MSDPLLKRVERRAMLVAALAAIVAAVLPGGGWLASAGILGGALLVGVSYWAIHAGVSGLADAVLAQGAGAHRPRRGLMWLVLRYALLAGMAYVMIARLRLPPIALLIGASVMVAAAALELVRGARRT